MKTLTCKCWKTKKIEVSEINCWNSSFSGKAKPFTWEVIGMFPSTMTLKMSILVTFRSFWNFELMQVIHYWKHTLRKARKIQHIEAKWSKSQINKILGDQILECIIANVKNAKYFTISADEARDGSMQTQLTMTLCSVDENGNTCIHTNTDTPKHNTLNCYLIVCIHKFPPHY